MGVQYPITCHKDVTGRRFAVEQEDLKLYWNSEKRPHFLKGSEWGCYSFGKVIFDGGSVPYYMPYAVEQEDLKPYWNSEKKATFFEREQINLK